MIRGPQITSCLELFLFIQELFHFTQEILPLLPKKLRTPYSRNLRVPNNSIEQRQLWGFFCGHDSDCSCHEVLVSSSTPHQVVLHWYRCNGSAVTFAYVLHNSSTNYLNIEMGMRQKCAFESLIMSEEIMKTLKCITCLATISFERRGALLSLGRKSNSCLRSQTNPFAFSIGLPRLSDHWIYFYVKSPERIENFEHVIVDPEMSCISKNCMDRVRNMA